MSDDWRVRVTLGEGEHAQALVGRLEARELQHEVADALGSHVAVSQDGPEVFLYAGTRAAARSAEQVVRADLERHGWAADVVLSRWHDVAGDWEPADAPLATDAAQREAEHARLMREEDAEAAAEGFASFEARAALPTVHAACELSERLEREGVPHARRWRYVFVGAADEDAAAAWAERLRGESPPGTTVSAEGTYGLVARDAPVPFRAVTGLGGGLP